MACGIEALDAVHVIANKPVLRLPLARQLSAGKIDHAGGVIYIVVTHRRHRQSRRMAMRDKTREQFLAGVLNAAAALDVVLGVVIVHDVKRLAQRR